MNVHIRWLKLECPCCRRQVKVVDPYENTEDKRASAWFARHKDWRTGKQCDGSNLTAIDRTPRPASEELTSEQIAILDHTANRASVRGMFCGDSEDMQRLVALGLMKSAERVAWCPDEYFRITSAGRAVLAERAATAGGEA